MASTSSTSAANSNRIGITGLASGMDTEATIAKIMKYQKAPIDKLKQKTQKLLWEQDTYRTQNTTLAQLRDQLLNLKLENTYNARKVNNSKPEVATATVAANAPNATYTLDVTKVATSATNISTADVSIRSFVLGDYLDPTATSPIVINAGAGNNQITISLDGGAAQTLTLTDGSYDSTNLADLVKDIQTQIDSKLTLKGTVVAKLTDDNEIEIAALQKDDGSNGAHTLVLSQGSPTDATLNNLGFKDQATTRELVSGIIATSTIDINSSNNTFKITLGNGTTQTITLDTNSAYTLTDLAANIKSKIQALGGDYLNVDVDVTKYSQIRITPTNTTGIPGTLKLEAVSGSNFMSQFFGGVDTVSSEQSNPLDTSSVLWNQKSKFMNSSFFEGRTSLDSEGQTVISNPTFSFAINGQSFTFDLTKNSLDDIIKTVNGNSKAGVSMYYDNFSDKLMLTASKTGKNLSGYNIAISDPNGFLGQVFNIDQTKENQGQNAEVSINGGPVTQKTENSFTMSGVTFNIVGTGKTTISIVTDPAAVTDQVQKFVENYNKLMTAMYTEITTERPTGNDKYTYYEPLTDEQKEAMSDDQISAWTEKAKTGLLHNDPLLLDTMSGMSMNLSRTVDTPRTITATTSLPTSGTFDLTGQNRLKITLGSQTREISLDEKVYDAQQFGIVTIDSSSQNFKIAVGNGLSQPVTLAPGTYTYTQLAAEVQKKIRALKIKDPTDPTGKTYLNSQYGTVTVTANSNNQLIISDGDAINSLPIRLESGDTADAVGTLGFQSGRVGIDRLEGNSLGTQAYSDLVGDIQNKLNMAFGTNNINVSLTSGNKLSFTTQNIALTLNNATQNNGLGKLGFSNGDTVKQTYNKLADIGITTGDYFDVDSNSDPLNVYKLTLDSDKFREAMNTDPDAVIRLLTYNGGELKLPDDATAYEKSQAQMKIDKNKGIFFGFYDLVNDSTTGIIKQFTNKAGAAGQSVSDVYELGQELNDIAKRVNELQDRFKEEEDRLYALFSRMETTINNFNAQSAWLTSQLGGGSSG